MFGDWGKQMVRYRLGHTTAIRPMQTHEWVFRRMFQKEKEKGEVAGQGDRCREVGEDATAYHTKPQGGVGEMWVAGVFRAQEGPAAQATSPLGPTPHTQALPLRISNGTAMGRNLSWASIVPGVNVCPQEVLAGSSLLRDFGAALRVWVWKTGPEGAGGRRLGGSWIVVGKDVGAPEEGTGHGDGQMGQEARVRPSRAWVLEGDVPHPSPPVPGCGGCAFPETGPGCGGCAFPETGQSGWGMNRSLPLG